MEQHYAEKEHLPIAESLPTLFQSINNPKSSIFDINEFCDLLEHVEYSKYHQQSDGMTELINLFNQTLPEIPYFVIEYIKELGYNKALPEPKVIIAEVTATNVLETGDRERAKQAKKEGYDLVIYSGEGILDESPEYLIADVSQITIKSMIIEDVEDYTQEQGLTTIKTKKRALKL